MLLSRFLGRVCSILPVFEAFNCLSRCFLLLSFHCNSRCGRGLMVERLPSKQYVRVRFPAPAQNFSFLLAIPPISMRAVSVARNHLIGLNFETMLGFGGKIKAAHVGGFDFQKGRVNYFTASLRAFAARNLGTFIAGTEIDSPVRGFRAWRAFRVLTEKMPRPAIDTSSPFLSPATMLSNTLSTTCSA